MLRNEDEDYGIFNDVSSLRHNNGVFGPSSG